MNYTVYFQCRFVRYSSVDSDCTKWNRQAGKLLPIFAQISNLGKSLPVLCKALFRNNESGISFIPENRFLYIRKKIFGFIDCFRPEYCKKHVGCGMFAGNSYPCIRDL